MKHSSAYFALFVFLSFLLVHHHAPVVITVTADEVANDSNGDLPKVEEGFGAVPPALSTDSDVVKRESESISSSRSLRQKSEKFEFQAEVSRLMDIIINSLYSNKDIFLRELISNASDALDKIRFLSLTDPDVLGDTTKLEIQIKLDKENKVLIIRDTGIGMTKEDLIKNLGTIAKSGTSAFLEQMQKGGDLNLIGQFGVGFYSVYLVADYVEVISKHNDDKQYIWESRADGKFAISEDTENEPLGRGTEIRIFLKDEASSYVEENKLKALVKRFSEFVNFPINLLTYEDIFVDVDDEGKPYPQNEEAEESTEEEDDDDEEEMKTYPEDGPSEEDLAAMANRRIVKERVWEWKQLNNVKAIWLRNPKEVTDKEYIKFYNTISKDIFIGEIPQAWTHFSGEGDVEFRAILFIPSKAPLDLYENHYYKNKSFLKLYVRRVFISEEFHDQLLPQYLAVFLRGMVDSDTLPLNVSREMLQQHSSLKTIKKKLVRKALDMIRKIAEEDPDEQVKASEEEEDGEESKSLEVSGSSKRFLLHDKRGKYLEFWNQFGKSVKLGIIQDDANRNRLLKLLRFHSTESEEQLTSLDKYIARMKPDQKDIYYITGSDKEQLKKSPLMERLKKKGYEVILFTDPLDEYLMEHLIDYERKKFQNISKEGLKLSEKSEIEEVKEMFKDLTKWWKDLLVTEGVDSVKTSDRLADTPAVVVTSKYGWSANMERIMKSMPLSPEQNYMRGRRILEINPRHPIIRELRDRIALDSEDMVASESAKVIYHTALIDSGFTLDNPKEFTNRFYSVLKTSLDIWEDEDVEEEEEAEESVSGVESTTSTSTDENAEEENSESEVKNPEDQNSESETADSDQEEPDSEVHMQEPVNNGEDNEYNHHEL